MSAKILLFPAHRIVRLYPGATHPKLALLKALLAEAKVK